MASKIGIDVEAKVGDAGFTRLTEQARKAADEIDRLFRPRSGKSWVDYELVKLDKYISKLREIRNEQDRASTPTGGGGSGGYGGGGSGGGGGRPPDPADRMRPRLDAEREDDRRSWWVRAGLYSQRIGGMAGAAGGALGSMMTGGNGGVAGAIGNILGGMAGAAAGAATGNPLIGLASGAFLSSVGGAIGGKVDAGVGTARENAVETSRLRYSMGELGNDFEELQYRARSAADAFSGVDAEAIRMGREMAKLSGASSGRALFADVETSGLLARSLGLDPGQVGGTIGALRGMGGVGGSDQGARKMGAIIGETIGKTGYIAKSAETMAALVGYVTSSERSSLLRQDAGVDNYGNMLATMVRRSGIADVSGMAGILSGADATFRSGGGSGEASQHFRLGAYQRALGSNFSGLDVGLLNEAGMFATPAQVFGYGGRAWQAADAQTRARYESYASGPGWKRSGIDTLMGAIEGEFGQGTDLMREAVAREMFGGNRSHADAFYLAWKDGGSRGIGSGVANMVGRNVGPAGTLAAAPFLHAGQADLEEQARRLIAGSGFSNKLTEDEKKSLKTGDENELREAVVKLTATREWDQDQGRQIESSVNQVENAITRFSSQLLPLAQDIRDSVLRMVDEADAASGAINRRNEKVAGGSWSIGSILGLGGGADGRVGKDLVNSAADAYGVRRKTLFDLMMQESGGNPDSVNVDGWKQAKSKRSREYLKAHPPTGAFQFTEPTFDDFYAQAAAEDPELYKRLGEKNWKDPAQQAYVTAWGLSHGKKGHWQGYKDIGSPRIFADKRDYDSGEYDKVPDGGMKSSAPFGWDPLNVKGTFELRHPATGAQLADPILKNFYAHPRLP